MYDTAIGQRIGRYTLLHATAPEVLGRQEREAFESTTGSEAVANVVRVNKRTTGSQEFPTTSQ